MTEVLSDDRQPVANAARTGTTRRDQDASSLWDRRKPEEPLARPPLA